MLYPECTRGEWILKIFKGVYGGYICYIGFFVQRSILGGKYILCIVFFDFGSIWGGNTARPPSRPDPRTGVRFCVDPAGGGLRRGPLTRRGAACILHGDTLRGGGGAF